MKYYIRFKDGGTTMFQSDSPFTKKLVTILITTVCIVLTLIVILSCLFSEKKPHIAGIIIVSIYDILWICMYIFYVRKK